MGKKDIVEYIDEQGISLFSKWLARLNAPAAAKVTTALYRMEQGNFSNTKSVGKGVFEFKIDTGPRYRIYFGQDGDVLVILLNGGTKKRQSEDIMKAQLLWSEYKRRKKLK